MLAKPNRLRLGRDIDRVFRQGRFGGAESLSAKALLTRRAEKRAVVIVSKKVSKKASVRNRIRRRLSELLQKHWQQIASGCDIVVTVKTDLSETPITKLESELLGALKRAGAIT